MNYYIGFTGNRPNEEEGRRVVDLEAKRKKVRTTLVELSKNARINGDTPVLLTGIAAGADTIACQEALKMGLTIHLFLPLEEKDYVRDFPQEFSGLAENLWQQADEVVKSIQPPSKLIWLTREKSIYAEINTRILDQTEVLISLNNGVDTGLIGGANQMTTLARARQIEVKEILTTEP